MWYSRGYFEQNERIHRIEMRSETKQLYKKNNWVLMLHYGKNISSGAYIAAENTKTGEGIPLIIFADPLKVYYEGPNRPPDYIMKYLERNLKVYLSILMLMRSMYGKRS